MDPSPAPGPQVALAYALSALSTFLWVCCVLPSGTLPVGTMEDLATPIYRETWLVVPALLLLVVGPVGAMLSRTRSGLLAVLGATDAFVAFYAGYVLTRWGTIRGTVSGVLVGLLYALGVLSVIETARVLRVGSDGPLSPKLRGLRLAICIMVLLTPAGLLLRDGQELASLLAPYALIALSAGGASLTRGTQGLRLTASLVQLALAIHLVVTLRYTIFELDVGTLPAFRSVSAIGWTTVGIAVAIAVLALLEAVLQLRQVQQVRPSSPTAVAS